MDSEWADAVLSAGEVALLSGQGGIGKSYLSLQWALAATRNETGDYGEYCGLRVRPGPVVILSYEDAPVRMAKRIENLADTAAPDGLFVLPAPEPLWKTEKGRVNAWDSLGRTVASRRPDRRELGNNRSGLSCPGGGDQRQRPGAPIHGRATAQSRDKRGGRPGGGPRHQERPERGEGGRGPRGGSGGRKRRLVRRLPGSVVPSARSVDRDRWLLECTKANYGRTGWGELLIEAKTHAGKFCGFSESGPALSAGEVEDLKAAWRNQVNNQTRERKKPNKTSGKDRAAGERNPY